MKTRYEKSLPGGDWPRMHGCPNCGLNHRLGELDLIPGVALGHFDGDGVWRFEGETKVCWDGQRQEHDPARFVCLNCDAVFDLYGKRYRILREESP